MARFGNIPLIYLLWGNFRGDCEVFALGASLRKIFVDFQGNFSRTIVRGENDRVLMVTIDLMTRINLAQRTIDNILYVCIMMRYYIKRCVVVFCDSKGVLVSISATRFNFCNLFLFGSFLRDKYFIFLCVISGVFTTSSRTFFPLITSADGISYFYRKISLYKMSYRKYWDSSDDSETLSPLKRDLFDTKNIK